MDTKRCPDCNEYLPLDRFHKNRSTKDGLTGYCKTHGYERKVAYQKAHPEKYRLTRRKVSVRRYGIEWSDFLLRWDKQDGRCALCGDWMDMESKHGWHVDHCHVTGGVRGILHLNCNAMLGHAGDDPVRLRQGADYLERLRG